MSAPTPSPFVARRARIAAAMRDAGGGIAIVPTAPERQRNSDNDHPYRHGSDFHYLTGFAEPGAWLVIGSDGRTTLVCRPKDVERELWDGIRLGPDAAPAALGVDDAVALDRLDETMVERLADQPAVWWSFDTPGLGARIDGWLERVRAKEPDGRRGAGRPARPGAAARGDARQEGRRRDRDDAPRRRDQRRRARAGDALLRRALRRRPARRDPRVRDRGRAAARVPPLGRRGAGVHLDRRRRRERLHPPLHAGRDAAEGGRALPDRRRLRARRLRQRRDAHLPRRRPLQRARSASSTTWSRRRRRPRSRRRSPARACAMPTPPRCASSPRACSTPACSTATPSATSTR